MMNKKLLIGGITMFLIGLSMILVSSFLVLGVNDFAFYALFVLGCMLTFMGVIIAIIGLCENGNWY